MAGLISNNAAFNWTSRQTQIADQINDLMANTFVRIAKTVFNRTVRINHKNIPGPQMGSDARRLHLKGFRFQHKSPGTGKIFGIIFLIQLTGIDLPANTGMLGIVQIIGDIKPVTVRGKRIDGFIVFGNTDGLQIGRAHV